VVLIFVPQMSFGMQAVVFAVFAVIRCYVYWHFVRNAMHERSDQPNLNRRAEQYVGRRFVLETAIVNGQGKARVGDTLWLAEGPDLPAGSPIEVVGVDGSTLKVKAA
jgi:membrane protein implicated in regulation of membrane protease activity